MTSWNRLALLSMLGMVLVACGPRAPTKEDGGTDGGGGGDCIEDTDCPRPDGRDLYFCNQSTGKCEPSCRSKTDCSDRPAGHTLDYCGGTLGCQCDEGRCVASLCSSDADCGSQVCRNGQCVAPPDANSITKCTISPDYVVTRGGAKARFYFSGWSAQNQPVVPKDGVQWSALNNAGTVAAGPTTLWADLTAADITTANPIDGVQAKIGSATCTAKVLIFGSAAPPANSLDVVVTDELSGRPVENATIVASNGTTQVGQAVATDAKGYARLSGITQGQITVTAFHNDYNYLTIANYDMSGGRFLSMVVRRNQVDKYGGYKGTFERAPWTSPNVHFGIAGMSLAGSITDLSLTQLLGPTEPTRVKIGTAIDRDNVPLPAGAFLGFAENRIKENVSAQGLAGVCSAAKGGEAAISSGSCGTRAAWALAGDVPLGDLPIDKFAGGLDNIDFSGVLASIIPIFKKFNSSVVRDVEFELRTTPRDAGEPVFSDRSFFTTQNHVFDQIPLGFQFAVRAPDLPQFKGSYADGLVMLGGANVPGRGVVPLGVGVAVNTNPVDAKTDPQAPDKLSSPLAPGLVTMRMAPTHHGIEGSEYGIVALALSLKSATDSSAGIATSAVFGRVKNNQLKFDPKASPENIIDLPGAGSAQALGGFLKFPEGAKYNYTDNNQPALNARTFRFASDPGLAGATVIRVVFTDRLDHRWVVYLDPAQATAGFTLPKPAGIQPPVSFHDRTFYMTGSDQRSPLLVQAIRLNDNPAGGGTAITFRGLVELNSTNADRMVDFTTGFSFIDYSRPDIDWVTPSSSGATIAAGSAIKVKVSAFKVGTAPSDDGYVRVTFAGGTGCTNPVDGKTDASQGKGEISMNLPAGCTGTNVQMTATLMSNVDLDGNPATADAIAPRVSTTISVNIQ